MKKIIHSMNLLMDSHYGLLINKKIFKSYFCSSPEKPALTSFPAKPSATPL